MSDEDLERYILSSAEVLRLPIEPEWMESIRSNLAVSMELATRVMEFDLPDAAEPAPVFVAAAEDSEADKVDERL